MQEGQLSLCLRNTTRTNKLPGRLESGFCCRVIVDLTRAIAPGMRRWFNYRVQGAKGTELQMDLVNAGDTQAALAVGGRKGLG